MVPNFEQLQNLSVPSYASQFIGQLQTIVDRALRLRTLHIDHDAFEPLDVLLLQLANSSIDHLSVYGRCLNEEECHALSRAPLTQQCKSLNVPPRTVGECAHSGERDAQAAIALSSLGIGKDSLESIRDRLPSSSLVSRSTRDMIAVRICLP